MQYYKITSTKNISSKFSGNFLVNFLEELKFSGISEINIRVNKSKNDGGQKKRLLPVLTGVIKTTTIKRPSPSCIHFL